MANVIDPVRLVIENMPEGEEILTAPNHQIKPVEMWNS